MSFIAAAVIGGVATIGGAVLGGKAADSQATAMKDSASMQYQAAQDNLEFAKEQWEVYETRILPLELEAQNLGIDAQQLALSRSQDEYEMYQDYYRPMQIKMSEIAMEGTEDRTEQVTRDAAERVSKEFERSRDISRRNNERAGLRPDSGRYQATDRVSGLQEAATRSSEINRAREGEQQRQEVTNFNMLASATGRAPAPYAPTQNVSQPGLNPTTTANMIASSNTAAGNAGLTAANAAGLQENYWASAIPSMASTGMDMYSAYNSYSSMNQPTDYSWMMPTQDMSFLNPVSSQPNYSSPVSTNVDLSMGFKDGGKVPVGLCKGGRVPGYKDGGKVEKDKDYSADNAATDYAKQNTGLFGFAARWRDEAKRKQLERMQEAEVPGYASGGPVSGPGGVDNVPATIDGVQPARLSAGEYVIPKDVVNAKGTEFFDKLLDSYHNGPTPGNAGLRG